MPSRVVLEELEELLGLLSSTIVSSPGGVQVRPERAYRLNANALLRYLRGFYFILRVASEVGQELFETLTIAKRMVVKSFNTFSQGMYRSLYGFAAQNVQLP